MDTLFHKPSCKYFWKSFTYLNNVIKYYPRLFKHIQVLLIRKRSKKDKSKIFMSRFITIARREQNCIVSPDSIAPTATSNKSPLNSSTCVANELNSFSTPVIDALTALVAIIARDMSVYALAKKFLKWPKSAHTFLFIYKYIQSGVCKASMWVWVYEEKYGQKVRDVAGKNCNRGVKRLQKKYWLQHIHARTFALVGANFFICWKIKNWFRKKKFNFGNYISL